MVIDTYDCPFCGRHYEGDDPEVKSRICYDDSCGRFWEEMGIPQHGDKGEESMNEAQLVAYRAAKEKNKCGREK